MYAIIKSGGKQFRVTKGDVIRVPLITGEVGSEVEIAEVLHVSDSGKQLVGSPLVSSASVKGRILNHGKDSKILVFTYKRRKGFEKRRGHRQGFTELQIEDIQVRA
jgi:large subunit ribosomal protein L21